MNTHADKLKENRNRSVAGTSAQQHNTINSISQFSDHRPEAIVQRKYQEMVDNSTNASVLAVYQKMANNSFQAQQAARLQTSVSNYAAQRDQPIQRMQLIATESDKREDDLTILNNIAFARAVNKAKGVRSEKTGSLFGNYSAADLDVAHGEIVFVHGHGIAGGFRDELTQGDIKNPQDEKGILSWDKTAQIIASKLGGSDAPLTIRMLSCHGAEPSDYPLPGVNPRGFVDAMVDYLGQKGVAAQVTAYNDPVISWGLLSSISLKAGPNYNTWFPTFEKAIIKPVTEELKQLALQPDFNYQKRINFIRQKIAIHDIDAWIQNGLETRALVENPPVTKQSTIVQQGEKSI